MIVEGSLSVKAALQCGRRTVYRLLIDEKKKDRDTGYILYLAKEMNVPVVRLKREELDAMASGRTHGGVLAETGERAYQDLTICLDDKTPFVVFLEGIEDPFNLGYIARTLAAVGCSGLMMPKRDFSYSEPVILKSSAGASERINWIMSEHPVEDIQTLKKAGLACICAYRDQAKDMYETDFTQPLILCIGGEMRGLSRDVLKESDQNMVIPYSTDFRNALNASSAAAAICFEAQRQRIKGETK
ncbi:MAG: RNA methyltransferase [Erysipelotrichaceae bacterium]|nr:RNA methyltransferase [Erysipelotrichaceae bacterium]